MLSFDAGIKGAAKNYTLALGSHVAGAPAVSTSAEESEALPTTNQSLIGCTAQLKICPSCNRMLPRDQVEYVVSSELFTRARNDIDVTPFCSRLLTDR